MESLTFEQIHQRLMAWAQDRDLLGKDPHVQLTKVMEELGETSAAYNKQKRDDFIDSIGDLLVTISIFCHQTGVNPVDCFNEAWDEIADRKGKTVNGTFIKEADLNA